MVAWNSYGQEGSGYGVFDSFASDEAGPVRVQVNTHTTGGQSRPSVALVGAAGDRRRLVQPGPGRQRHSVFGQRFSSDAL